MNIVAVWKIWTIAANADGMLLQLGTVSPLARDAVIAILQEGRKNITLTKYEKYFVSVGVNFSMVSSEVFTINIATSVNAVASPRLRLLVSITKNNTVTNVDLRRIARKVTVNYPPAKDGWACSTRWEH